MVQPKLIINLTDGSLSLLLSESTTQEVLEFLTSFTAKIQEQTPDRKQTMEYRHIGEVFLEIFGNPNIYANTFSAKVLLTVRDDKMRLTVEIGLTRLIEDIQQYLEQIKP
jgi:hypothetical protein